MNIVDAAKAVLAELDKFGEIDKCHDALLVEALRKAVVDAEGMVLVPIEPTAEMVKAAIQNGAEGDENIEQYVISDYKAMLAAAKVSDVA